MGFIGRERELQALEDMYQSRQGAFVPVYGRRRVGKTELILRFIRRRPHVYFTGKRAPAALQIQEFLEAAADSLRAPLLATATRDQWKRALLQTVEQWRGPGKLVLALDEFQWMAEASPELPSVLQECWDRHWRDSGRVMLILCGSYVGFMEREVLGRKSPLFGRRTAQIRLQPFGYREAGAFHPRYSVVDRARTYFLCGGIPQYLRCVDDRRSVEANITALLLDPIGALYDEPEFLLREELREVEKYSAILMSLAQRAMSVVEIGQVTGVGRSAQYHLQQLVELGYVARRYPLSGAPPSKKSVRYALEDPLLRFWFRFIWPARSLLAQETPAKSFASRIRPHLDAYFGACFERLCREAVPSLYAREGVEAAAEVGEFWSRDAQIDVVSVREDGVIDLGECKWGALRSARAAVKELDARARALPNPNGATIRLLLFTKNRVKDAGDATAYCLDDLYATG